MGLPLGQRFPTAGVGVVVVGAGLTVVLEVWGSFPP